MMVASPAGGSFGERFPGAQRLLAESRALRLASRRLQAERAECQRHYRLVVAAARLGLGGGHRVLEEAKEMARDVARRGQP